MVSYRNVKRVLLGSCFIMVKWSGPEREREREREAGLANQIRLLRHIQS